MFLNKQQRKELADFKLQLKKKEEQMKVKRYVRLLLDEQKGKEKTKNS